VMTQKQFERVTGHELETGEHSLSTVCDCKDEHIQIRVPTGLNDPIRVLADKVYKHHSRIIMERQGYRCRECGNLGRLEIDHIVPRSKGRDDRLHNLRAVCASFTGCRVHQLKHG
jgi:5-methylcytosine-specific restriction endonuclease McrA